MGDFDNDNRQRPDVIDVEVEDITKDTPQPVLERLVYRFVGNHLTLNASHLAYVLNIIGVNVPPETYEKMPNEIKAHFMAVKV